MLTLNELNELMGDVDEWSLESDGINKIFSFKDFKEAKEFVDKVCEIAEAKEHHPDIMWNFNQVRLSLTTHSEHGLTKKDFEVAREIDKL
jgi:4a-hydroxytetrahydrobiopterin dehydratase